MYGATGAEGTFADTLAGQTDFGSFGDAIGALAGADVPGNDVYLTIDSRIQAAAEAALAGETGGVVVLDGTTGAVLASASAPTYDNNGVEELLAQTGDTGEGPGGGTTLLFNRATQGLYAPGSTFKTVTLTSALTQGSVTLDTTFDAPGSIDIGNAKVTNFDGYSYGTISVLKGFELSSNTLFAQVADTIGAEQLVSTAKSFGFGTQLDTDFDSAASLMPDPGEMTQWETAWAGVGQPVGEHASPAGPQATVLQMAMVASAVANDGVLMRPHILNRVVSAQGETVEVERLDTVASVMSPSVAGKVQTAMAGVVEQGTGTAAQIGGYAVHGKTGTAESNNAQDNSWFIGYVEVGGRQVVVAIVVEQTYGGATTAKARDILQAAIEVYG
jgi:peptidoglycan glycosyltransferase